MAKNTTYMSHFTVDEIIKLISDKIEAKFLHNLLTSNDFSILKDKSLDEAEKAQLTICVHYIDSSTYETFEHYVCIRKLSTSKAVKTLMVELEQMVINKKSMKRVLDFLV